MLRGLCCADAPRTRRRRAGPQRWIRASLAMNAMRATVDSCVGLPVRSRIADKAWARGMRRETRDARRETRDARRETRDARRETRDARRETRDARRETRAWDWQRGAWAQMQRGRSEAPGAVYAHKLASITECLRVSLWVDAISRSVGPRVARGERRLDDHHAERSVPCEAKPDYQPCELDVTTVLGEARANACPERFMRINRGPRDRPLCHVSQKPPEKN
ncbi:putative membrane protein [Paraburkholderia graminis]|uniref:Membrane protein n=1 Tax=Paraburkholderia graminis TaxID=60548 RepID=A0ABD5CIZ1_9BURK|nr:putative membrane protein [Paraburkholderia graminis]